MWTITSNISSLQNKCLLGTPAKKICLEIPDYLSSNWVNIDNFDAVGKKHGIIEEKVNTFIGGIAAYCNNLTSGKGWFINVTLGIELDPEADWD